MKEKQAKNNDNQVAAEAVGWTRCAVAKIDLKGRFVYLDDLISDILGSSQEALFGRQLLDFVHEDCHERLNRLIEQRSHYESTFESIRLSLLTPGGGTTEKNCVISLNFIAGNPVNFQLVFVSDTIATSDMPEAQTARSGPDPVRQLLSCDFTAGLSVAAADLAEFCGAKAVLAYQVDDTDAPTLLNESTVELEAFPLTEWHLLVAARGGSYDCASADDVQAAVEAVGQAPVEYFEIFERRDKHSMLVRVVFDERDGGEALQLSTARARVAAALLPGLVAINESETNDPMVPQTATLAEAVGMAGVGVLQTDSQGRITAYNAALADNCDRTNLSGNIQDLLNGLRGFNRRDTINMIGAMTKTALESGTCIPEKVALTLPSGARGQMIISVRPGDDNEQKLTAVFLPAGPETNPGCSWNLTADLVDVFGRLMQPSIETASSLGEKLAHEFHSELGGNGRFYLQCLDQQMARQTEFLKEMQFIASELHREPSVEPCDLELIVHKLIGRLSRSHPHRQLGVKSSGENHLLSLRQPLFTILEGIAVACLNLAAINPELTITAQEQKNTLSVIVKTDCPVDKKQIQHLFEPVLSGQTESCGTGTRPVSLFSLKNFARVLGGDLDATADRDGLTFTLKLPGRLDSGKKGGEKG